MTAQEQNARIIAEELAKDGVTRQGIAGVLGNFEAESGLIPCRKQGDVGGPEFRASQEYAQKAYINEQEWIRDSVGFGLGQWTYWSRKMELLNYCKDTGSFVGDIIPQMEFFIKECQRDYRNVWVTLTDKNSTIAACSNAMLLWYERPADMSLSAQNYRSGLAQAWFNKLDNLQQNLQQVANPVASSDKPKKEPSKLKCRTIQQNLEWPEVWLLQALLKMHGYNVLIDGIFQKALDEKVRQFQKDHGLEIDGVVGPKTWNALGVKT